MSRGSKPSIVVAPLTCVYMGPIDILDSTDMLIEVHPCRVKTLYKLDLPFSQVALQGFLPLYRQNDVRMGFEPYEVFCLIPFRKPFLNFVAVFPYPPPAGRWSLRCRSRHGVCRTSCRQTRSCQSLHRRLQILGTSPRMTSGCFLTGLPKRPAPGFEAGNPAHRTGATRQK